MNNSFSLWRLISSYASESKNRSFRFLCFIFLLSSQCLFAQQGTIRGRVLADGTGVPGATVQVKGTASGTQTNDKGEFTLTVSPNSILIISAIGFTTQEVRVNNRMNIDIQLESATKTLEQLVVVGYGTTKRKDLTGAISSVSASQIEKVPVSTLDQALQGRATGVQVTNNDGSPGAAVSVRIRGIGTFGDNSPLYVVDGYPISGGLSNLNPSDIATIDILKDASATAIYGNRAANGVVVITTKRGRKDGIQVTVDAVNSFQSKPKKFKVLTAQQFGPFATEIAKQSNYEVLPEWSNPSSLRNIDWQDEVYQMGLRQNYNIAVRGGNDKVQTAFSAGMLDHKGVVIESYYKRYNAGLNLDYTPSSWLKVSNSVKYARTDGTVRLGSGQSGIGNLTKLIPTMTGNPLTDQVKDANGNYGYFTKGKTVTSGSNNIVADIETQDTRNANNNLLASSSLEVTPVSGLRLKTNFGINYSDYSGYYFTPTNHRVEPAGYPFYSQSANNTFEWLWENTVAYTKTFNKIHSVDFVGGVSAQQNTFRQIGGSGSQMVSDELRDLGSVQRLANIFGNQQSWSLASQFGRLSYKLLDRYIVTGTIRRDGSSRFSDGNKWGVFPSVSASWRMIDENFIKDIKWISDLKIRGSYGTAGNQNIGLFQYQGNYGSGTTQDNRGYVFGASKVFYDGIALQNLPNKNLVWETSKQGNIGLDVSVLDNRLSLTADYYRRVSSDFLLQIAVPAQTGFPQATKNVGSIENKGIELGLSYRKTTGDFTWEVAGNVTTVKNKILKLAPGQTGQTNFSNLGFPDYGGNTWQVFSNSMVGGSLGAFYGFKSAGIFQSQQEIDELNAAATKKNNNQVTYYQASTTSPGDRKFMDLDGDGKITDADRTIIGSPIPKFYGGVNYDASYKNFDLSLFFYYSVGNDIFNYARRNLESLATNGGVGVQNVGEDWYLHRWTPTNPSTTMARAVREDVNGNGRPSDYYVEDGSYLRLRSLMLGYTLPSEIAKRLHVGKVRVYVSGQNLFTITGYSGLDPEIGEQSGTTASGIDLGTFPSTRNFTVGLNVQF
ncbi:TonB-dependent receptor [Chitinophaga silvatica]|uniref:TonB-dependent receptor n=1 Tax=Chitinophaga silvatica TaxID=2282649 RepID=A0A3E1Y6Y3_9BACT|nr:TonB-dependent receptor [Chitinophaga silvatica]RFS20704.1 TonB-dependent receptor [Chitinophaga silvatica]